MKPEDYPQYGDLRIIRRVLEREVDGFPNKSCKLGRLIVREMLSLEGVTGLYIFAEEEERKPVGHHWNYDPKRGLIVDITADQFQKQTTEPIPKIVVVPVGDLHYQAVNDRRITPRDFEWTPEQYRTLANKVKYELAKPRA